MAHGAPTLVYFMCSPSAECLLGDYIYLRDGPEVVPSLSTSPIYPALVVTSETRLNQTNLCFTVPIGTYV